MKQQVELFDCAIFLGKFQELVPVDKKSVSFFFSNFYSNATHLPCVKFAKKDVAFLIKEKHNVNTYSLILKSKLPTHKRLSSTWFDFTGSNGKGILESGCKQNKHHIPMQFIYRDLESRKKDAQNALKAEDDFKL